MGRYELRLRDSFQACRLRHGGESGRCGRQWQVEAVVSAARLEEGMVCDLTLFRSLLRQATGSFDQSQLDELPVFRGITPTLEQIAGVMFGELQRQLQVLPAVRLESVQVWESEAVSVTYRPERRPPSAAVRRTIRERINDWDRF